jgi:hypothetical protein
VHHPGSLPDFHCVTAVVGTPRRAIDDGIVVMGEIVRLRFMNVAGSVKKEKTIGSHSAPRLTRHHPDKPSTIGSAFRDSAREDPGFPAMSRNDWLGARHRRSARQRPCQARTNSAGSIRPASASESIAIARGGRESSLRATRSRGSWSRAGLARHRRFQPSLAGSSRCIGTARPSGARTSPV